MARPLRLEYSGAVYHITARGNAKADIFLDDADRRIFLRILGSTIDRYGWLLHVFCLMGNHYHLLLETPSPNLSRGMRQVNGVYTQCFNRRHKHVGHVFQGRFGAILVERESYLLELARYLPLNPVRAGFVSAAAQWPWSSYRATAGLEASPPWLTVGAVVEHFGKDPGRAATRFQEFVQAGLHTAAPWSGLRGQAFLGSEHFVKRMEAALTPFARTSEIRRADRLAARPSLGSLFAGAWVANLGKRNAMVVHAHRLHGYSLAEIARHLGLHYSTVSRVVQAADAPIQDLTPA